MLVVTGRPCLVCGRQLMLTDSYGYSLKMMKNNVIFAQRSYCQQPLVN